MTDRTFSVSTGHWHSSSGTRGMSLEIKDESSGEMLVLIQLTPEQAYDLMRGAHQTVEGTQTGHLDRIGKTMKVDTLDVPRSERGAHISREAELEAAVQWARSTAPGWDTYEPRRTNRAGGVRVVMRRWV